ncbi:hypothetical protein LBMAG07_07890 [Actinomycetes bacterium]|nr:hypothetical protein LBMAG07_07890 [Actinomycetes bacterium]
MDKNCCNFWVKPDCEKHRGKFHGVRTKHTGLIADGESMQVDDAMEYVVVVLP